uniref:Uncharacterized protein n=1 Tax=Bartonella rochalimae ATCC BAA-1498 TaxID=685782 RepID=E6YKC4_9HYPH|nr:hypothetical protein BARRO_10245 [Bartonella rochalimae ATCC BAA-1498]
MPRSKSVITFVSDSLLKSTSSSVLDKPTALFIALNNFRIKSFHIIKIFNNLK